MGFPMDENKNEYRISNTEFRMTKCAIVGDSAEEAQAGAHSNLGIIVESGGGVNGKGAEGEIRDRGIWGC